MLNAAREALRLPGGMMANESVHAEPTCVISPTVRMTMAAVKIATVTPAEWAGAAAKPRLAPARQSAAQPYPRSARRGVRVSTLNGYCRTTAHTLATA